MPTPPTRVAEKALAGITLVPDTKRFYPEGESAAHIVGFTNNEDNGQEGIELAANARLTGEQGQREVIRDRLGRVISEIGEPAPAQNGETIQLTIDRRIQQLAHAQLKAAITKHQARAGSVVVLDARNGEILALANYPTFDPNDRARLTGEQLRNRALTDTFEPGSTIKPLVAALSIDLGKARPDTRIDTSPGSFKLGPNVIHDTSNHGVITVSQAVQMSSNIALTKLALQLRPETMWQKYREYGIGSAPELTFPGAATGRLRAHERWKPIEQATMAYGYGLSLSLLQIAQVYTAYAGNGHFHPATLVLDDKRHAPVAVTQARDRRGDPHHARNGDGTGRHGARGDGRRLPRRRQDGHGAQAGRARVREEQIPRVVRRHGADERAARDRRGDDRRAVGRVVLRRNGGGAGVLGRRRRDDATARRAARRVSAAAGGRGLAALVSAETVRGLCSNVVFRTRQSRKSSTTQRDHEKTRSRARAAACCSTRAPIFITKTPANRKSRRRRLRIPSTASCNASATKRRSTTRTYKKTSIPQGVMLEFGDSNVVKVRFDNGETTYRFYPGQRHASNLWIEGASKKCAP